MNVGSRRRASWLIGAVTLAAIVFPGAIHAASSDYTRPGQRVELQGRIRSLDTRDTEFVLTLDRTNERITVRARGASIQDRTQAYLFRDLREDEEVEVEGSWVDRRTVQARRVVRLDDGDWDRDDRYDGDREDRYDRDRRGRDRYDRDRRDRYDRYDRYDREERTRNGISGVVTEATGNITRTMKVRVGSRDWDVEVPRNIPILRDGRSASIHNVKVGEFVRIRGNWNGDRLRADRVEAFSDEGFDDDRADRRNVTLAGTVERLDRRNETFRLRTRNRTFEVDARDAVVREGRQTRRFTDLREGDRVRIFIASERGSRLTAEEIRIRPARDDRDEDWGDRDDRNGRSTIGGRVESVDHLNRTLRVRTNVIAMLVYLPTNVDIREENGGRMNLRDIREGDSVRVSGTRRGSNRVYTADRVDVYSR